MKRLIQDFQVHTSHLAQGRPVICLLRHDSGDTHGIFIAAAERICEHSVNVLARYGRGVISAGITHAIAAQLNLRPINHGFHSTRPNVQATVSIDARYGIHTGISAKDRAITLQLLGSSASQAEDFVQPGHIFPYVVHPQGVLGYSGAAEVASDMARLAGLNPVGTFCTILDDEGNVADAQYVKKLARDLRVPLIDSVTVQTYRLLHESFIQRVHIKTTTRCELITYEDHLHNDKHFIFQNRCKETSNRSIYLHRAEPTNDLFFPKTPNTTPSLHTLRQKVLDTGGVLVYVGQRVPQGIRTEAVIVQLLHDVGLDVTTSDLDQMTIPGANISLAKAQKTALLTDNLQSDLNSSASSMAKM